MRFATILLAVALAVGACSGKQSKESKGMPVDPLDPCAGASSPTKAEADAHMDTFGCPPCPCGASCPPCDSFGGKDPGGTQDDIVEPVPSDEPDAGAPDAE